MMIFPEGTTEKHAVLESIMLTEFATPQTDAISKLSPLIRLVVSTIHKLITDIQFWISMLPGG